MVTKKELLTGVIRYVKNEVIPHVSDRGLKMVLSAVLYAVDAKPDILDPFLNNTIVLTILQSENGMYDTTVIFDVLGNLAKEYGGIPIVIPPVKFITATETMLTFKEGDIEELKKYVEKSSAKEEE